MTEKSEFVDVMVYEEALTKPGQAPFSDNFVSFFDIREPVPVLSGVLSAKETPALQFRPAGRPACCCCRCRNKDPHRPELLRTV